MKRRRSLLFALLAVAGVAAFAAGWSLRLHYLPAPIFCDDVTCALLAERLTAIADQIADAGEKPRYLAIGDSITQGAALPILCGRIGINAGISGATTRTFEGRVPGLVKSARPDFVVIGLGTNDALRGHLGGFRERLAAIVGSVDRPVIAIPIHPGPAIPDANAINAAVATLPTIVADPVEPGHTVADGIHFDPEGSQLWAQALTRAVGLRTTALCQAGSNQPGSNSPDP